MTYELADVLDTAADTIESRGHYRGALEGPDGSVCVHGALNVAVWGDLRPTWLTVDSFPTEERLALRGAAADVLSPHTDGFIAEWSDATPTQTVLDTLRRVAKAVRVAADEAVGGAS